MEMAAKWIDAVDAETADADFEPTLGAPEYPDHLRGLSTNLALKVTGWARGVTDDREADGSRWGALDSDFEPALGAPEAATPLRVVKISASRLKRQRIRVISELGLDQRRWNRGVGDHEGEPSLAFADLSTCMICGGRDSPHLNEGLMDADLEEQCEGGGLEDESDFEPDHDVELSGDEFDHDGCEDEDTAPAWARL